MGKTNHEQYTYEIKETHIESDFSMIEKTGIKAEFTINDIKANEKTVEKAVKEINANVEVKEAIMTNVENNNDWIKDMDPEKIHACFIYREAYEYVTEGKAKVEELENGLKASQAERKEIEKQVYGK